MLVPGPVPPTSRRWPQARQDALPCAGPIRHLVPPASFWTAFNRATTSSRMQQWQSRENMRPHITIKRRSQQLLDGLPAEPFGKSLRRAVVRRAALEFGHFRAPDPEAEAKAPAQMCAKLEVRWNSTRRRAPGRA